MKVFHILMICVLLTGCSAKYPVWRDLPGEYTSTGRRLNIERDSTFILRSGEDTLTGKWVWAGIDGHWNDHYIRPENASLLYFTRWQDRGTRIKKRGPVTAIATKIEDSLLIEVGFAGGRFVRTRR